MLPTRGQLHQLPADGRVPDSSTVALTSTRVPPRGTELLDPEDDEAESLANTGDPAERQPVSDARTK